MLRRLGGREAWQRIYVNRCGELSPPKERDSWWGYTAQVTARAEIALLIPDQEILGRPRFEIQHRGQENPAKATENTLEGGRNRACRHLFGLTTLGARGVRLY